MISMKKIKCPYCGYEGDPKEFTFIYESVLYLADHEVLPEQRERPVVVVCPKCGRGFFLESPYKKLLEKMKTEDQK
ncbi:hypothetical protein Shell_0757 [Staphylothermus hellenicus DSM 12710]|uniref:Uncharacterized protein n=2 Tax=Staphylothermus hellenicus TaxID=84599 RepID=D7D7X7_STAHD|nr:hypothetical protein Shell_0757 [Staphylothermus hellenicus DSM 12710]